MNTRELASFIRATKASDLPRAAFEAAKNCMLDGLAVMLAGSRHPSVLAVNEYLKSAGGVPESTVVGQGRRASAPLAGLANGTMCHILDFDDTSWMLRGHPTAVILPAVLATGEKVGASGRDVLTAFILGFEAACRVASAVQPVNYNRGYHSTSALGIFGAVSAAAKLLKLEQEQLCSAFGIAAAESGGLRANFGSPTKALQAGLAAHGGIAAALLAGFGHEANKNILEAEAGFFQVFGHGTVSREPLGLSASDPAILSSGVAVKNYPSCARTHSALDAVLTIITAHDIDPSRISRVLCETDDETFGILIHPDPKNGLEAKFSMPYCLARACLDGSLKPEHFRDEAILDPAVIRMMEKVEHKASDEIIRKGFEYRASSTVSILLADGAAYRESVDRAKGSPGAPLSIDELASKFLSCAEPVVGPEKAAEIVSIVSRFEDVSDLGKLAGLLISRTSDQDKAEKTPRGNSDERT